MFENENINTKKMLMPSRTPNGIVTTYVVVQFEHKGDHKTKTQYNGQFGFGSEQTYAVRARFAVEHANEI